MKKIIVIGCPGSGKSVFSRKLHEKTKIPLIHLDMLYWNADRTTVGREVFLERLLDALKKDAWIIDGDYASTMEMRMNECDTVFFLDYPVEVCLDGARKRVGIARSDIPWVENREDEELIEVIKNYALQKRPEVFELFEKYPDKSITVFKSRDETERFLNSINS